MALSNPTASRQTRQQQSVKRKHATEFVNFRASMMAAPINKYTKFLQMVAFSAKGG